MSYGPYSVPETGFEPMPAGYEPAEVPLLHSGNIVYHETVARPPSIFTQRLWRDLRLYDVFSLSNALYTGAFVNKYYTENTLFIFVVPSTFCADSS